jgi:hypothetical protein
MRVTKDRMKIWKITSQSNPLHKVSPKFLQLTTGIFHHDFLFYVSRVVKIVMFSTKIVFSLLVFLTYATSFFHLVITDVVILICVEAMVTRMRNEKSRFDSRLWKSIYLIFETSRPDVAAAPLTNPDAPHVLP